MYVYQGDGSGLIHGLEPRDYDDAEVAAMPDHVAWLVRTSAQFRREADRPAKAPARASKVDGAEGDRAAR